MSGGFGCVLRVRVVLGFVKKTGWHRMTENPFCVAFCRLVGAFWVFVKESGKALVWLCVAVVRHVQKAATYKPEPPKKGGDAGAS